MLATLVEFGLNDDWQHMIDSATVRGDVSAAVAKGRLIRRLLVNRAAAFTCKVHACCDNQGRPLGFLLTGGEASDCGAVEDLMALPVNKPNALLADKG